MKHLLFPAGARQESEVPPMFNGGDAVRQPGLQLGTSDFTISVQAKWSGADGTSGDLISQFDTRTRTGFSLSLASLEGSCTSQATVRQLSFGIDAGSDPVWVDIGNPGGNSIFPFALCEYRGSLHAGTCVAEAGQRGGLFRHDGGNQWTDLQCPCVGNAITAMAVLEDVLYVAASSYDTSGTHLARAGNTATDGHVYAFDGATWSDCGKVSECRMVGGLVTLNGELYATAMEQSTDVKSRPDNGLYRMKEPGTWEFLGNPGERVVPITARHGKLFAGGWNEGGVYAYDPLENKWEDWGRPGEATQIYSFVEYGGELLVGTWKDARVFAVEGPNKFRDLGILGNELEVMGMAVYNGKLYAGTLPLAQIYRYEEGKTWSLIDRLEHTDTEYRRAWSMGLHGGRLYCGVVPSGHVYAMTAGRVASAGIPFPQGWCHIAAVCKSGILSLYINGQLHGSQAALPDWQLNHQPDLSNELPLTIGGGPTGGWRGAIANLRIFSTALSPHEVAQEAAAAFHE